MVGGRQASVDWALEDEPDAVLLPDQLCGTEGAGGVEGVGAVGQGDLGPVLGGLLRAHVSAGGEGVGGGPCVHVEARLAAQPEGHVGAHSPAHGALALVGFRVAAVAPVVVAVHVAAAEVGPGLLLLHHLLAADAGEGQRVEPHRALRPGGVDLLPERLDVLLGGCVEEAVCGPPEQCGPAQVDEGAILQHVGLTLHLQRVDRKAR